MAGVPFPESSTTADPFAVRPPRQRRSRESWARVLDAGVTLLEEGGYDAFTIAAVCERARVPPRALYERVDTKDGLFMAVYEHKLSEIRADQEEMFAAAATPGAPDREVVERAVRALVALFDRHGDFL